MRTGPPLCPVAGRGKIGYGAGEHFPGETAMSIQTVGIQHFVCPVRIREKGGDLQQTVATVDLLARMPEDRLESCVAVMTALLAEHLPDIHAGLFPTLLARVRDRLHADEARLPADRERAEMQRRQLFVAMTRARDRLWLGTVAPTMRSPHEE